MPRFTPPYYGAAYYPEDWPLEQIDDDVALMKEAGMNCMRVAEFAWARMEPEEGRFDFDWLHAAVDKLAAADIATIMCTPSPTPPAWLTERYPETLFVPPSGAKVTHGGRRHTCPNSPVYREHCERITRKMAAEFGRDDRIVGWQIDNEVAPHYDFGAATPHFFTSACTCPICMDRFAAFLKERYGTIDQLNAAWDLNLWSQKYDRFDQVPKPTPGVWHHPSLLMAWDEFSSRSYVDFVKHQADLLHELTDHPIGTDMMPFHIVDHYDINENLDVVQFNHYNFWEGLRDCALWFDFFRPIHGRPLWNTETATGWGGGTAPSGYSEPGFCRANSWLPIALGGEANLFWLWRTHWAGQELMHGSVVSTAGRPMHMFGEVQEVSAGFKNAADFINGTQPVKSGLALHFSSLADVTLKRQAPVHGFHYVNEMTQRVYHPLLRAQYRPDVIDPRVDLDDYQVVVSMFMPSLDDRGLRERLKAWIEAGGIWIAGPWTDSRTNDGTKFIHAPYGTLEEWGGVYTKYEVPGHPRAFTLHWGDHAETSSSLWNAAFELRGAEALATYTEAPFAGLSAITRHRMGQGQVMVMGTMPPAERFVQIVASACAEAGIAPAASASANLLAVPRSGPGGEGLIAVELDNQPAAMTLEREVENLLTGERVSGTLAVPPYGVAALRYV